MPEGILGADFWEQGSNLHCGSWVDCRPPGNTGQGCADGGRLEMEDFLASRGLGTTAGAAMGHSSFTGDLQGTGGDSPVSMG